MLFVNPIRATQVLSFTGIAKHCKRDQRDVKRLHILMMTIEIKLIMVAEMMAMMSVLAMGVCMTCRTDARRRMTLRDAHDHPWMTAGKVPIGEDLEPAPPLPTMCHLPVSRRGVEGGKCLSIGDWHSQERGDVRCRGAVVGRMWIASLSNVESCIYSEQFFGSPQLKIYVGT